jgi:hypothetical protein
MVAPGCALCCDDIYSTSMLVYNEEQAGANVTTTGASKEKKNVRGKFF